MYVMHRYRKLSRDVPQSRWDVDAKVAVGMDQKFEVNSSVRRGSVAGPETEVVEIGSRYPCNIVLIRNGFLSYYILSFVNV